MGKGTTVKGGRRRPFKMNGSRGHLKAFQRSMRERLKDGFGHGAGGQPRSLDKAEDAMGRSLLYGSKVGR